MESFHLTRRGFVAGITTLVALPAYAASRGGPLLAYLGSYTAEPPGANGHGEGIYLVRLEPEKAQLELVKLAAKTPSPSWLALSPDRRFLYAVNELNDYGGAKSGSVSAFAVDRASGDLKPLNIVASGGAAPAHLSVHPSGKFVLVANYTGGSAGVLPVGADGSLGNLTDLQHDDGPLNPDHAADEPPGNFAKSDHSGAHVHMIAADPSGRFVIASDAGLDRLYVWKFDATAGKLTPSDPPFVAVTPGAAPRHFVFHPNGRFLYSLMEHDGHLLVFAFDPATARLTLQQSISVLPAHFAGSNLASELVMAPDGRFLYAAHRLHDAVSILAVAADGKVRLVGEAPVGADYPRGMGLSPDGQFLLACNQLGNSVTLFRRDADSGALHFTGDFLPIGTPTVVAFL